MEVASERQDSEPAFTTESADHGASRVPRSRRLTALLWAVFALGIVIQAFSAHLEIRNHAFGLPATVNAPHGLDPSQLISRERKLQARASPAIISGFIGVAGTHTHVSRSYVIFRALSGFAP
jgi:hypothetical protein